MKRHTYGLAAVIAAAAVITGCSSHTPTATPAVSIDQWWRQWSTQPCTALSSDDLTELGFPPAAGSRYPTPDDHYQCWWRTPDTSIVVRAQHHPDTRPPASSSVVDLPAGHRMSVASTTLPTGAVDWHGTIALAEGYSAVLTVADHGAHSASVALLTRVGAVLAPRLPADSS